MWAGVDIENLRKSIYPQGATAGILSYAYFASNKEEPMSTEGDDVCPCATSRPCGPVSDGLRGAKRTAGYRPGFKRDTLFGHVFPQCGQLRGFSGHSKVGSKSKG